MLRAFELHSGQDVMLTSLLRQDGQTMGELATAMGVKPPTVTKMVDRMSRMGLLRRAASSRDTRQFHVHLTPAGAALARQIGDTWVEVDDQLLKGLKDKDRRRLTKLLSKIQANATDDLRPSETRD